MRMYLFFHEITCALKKFRSNAYCNSKKNNLIATYLKHI